MTNPTLISTPFATAGGKNTIQESVPLEPNNPTWLTGFPTITSTPVSEGGLPPKRLDFNGVLNAITENTVHQTKGLGYEFDATYATKIGGYPLHAVLTLTNGDRVQSTVANNIIDPNVDMIGWKPTKDSNVITTVESVADLIAIPNPKNGQVVYVKSYHLGLNIGGWVFSYDSNKPKSSHNGGSVIDPNKTFPPDWSNQTQLTSWFTPASSGLGCWGRVAEDISLVDFGARGDGSTNDTIPIQFAVTSGIKKVNVPTGISGVYNIHNTIIAYSGGVTISWNSNSIKFKKMFNGDMIRVNAASVILDNIGLDGNAPTYSGGGVSYGDSPTYFTYGCRITNPDIRNTLDSCVIFMGSRGAPDIVIDGGILITWQNPVFSGASSSGFPSIRIKGAIDTGGPAPRVFTNITASTAILLDATGMNGFKMSNCFTGTILYQGNPDATGGTDPYRTGQSSVNNTYIRDGVVIAGFENTLDSCICHGNTPLTWDSYGGKPLTYSSSGWEISSNSSTISLGSTNIVSFGIQDNSPQGVATRALSSLYSEEMAFATTWKGYSSAPSIGNGSLVSAFDNAGKFINFRMNLTIGSTTSKGVGEWSFTLPRWANLAYGCHGVWSGYIPSVGRVGGTVVLYDNGVTHSIAMLSADGTKIIGSDYPAVISEGSIFQIGVYYLRG